MDGRIFIHSFSKLSGLYLNFLIMASKTIKVRIYKVKKYLNMAHFLKSQFGRYQTEFEICFYSFHHYQEIFHFLFHLN